MIEDLSRFSKAAKDSVQKNFLRRDLDGRKRILDIADLEKVPCIVVLYFCGEVSGYPDYLKSSLDNIVKYYNYTEVRNKPEGCPW